MIVEDLLRLQAYETAIMGNTAVLIVVKLLACREATHSIASDIQFVVIPVRKQFQTSSKTVTKSLYDL